MQDPAIRHLVNVLLDDQRTRWSGGLERFMVSLSSEAGREAFEEWRAAPTTRLFLDALKSLSETASNEATAEPVALALAHGALCGLSLAARLVDDPTRVFPSIFDGAQSLMGRKAPDPVRETYISPPETERADTPQ